MLGIRIREFSCGSVGDVYFDVGLIWKDLFALSQSIQLKWQLEMGCWEGYAGSTVNRMLLKSLKGSPTLPWRKEII